MDDEVSESFFERCRLCLSKNAWHITSMLFKANVESSIELHYCQHKGGFVFQNIRHKRSLFYVQQTIG